MINNKEKAKRMFLIIALLSVPFLLLVYAVCNSYNFLAGVSKDSQEPNLLYAIGSIIICLLLTIAALIRIPKVQKRRAAKGTLFAFLPSILIEACFPDAGVGKIIVLVVVICVVYAYFLVRYTYKYWDTRECYQMSHYITLAGNCMTCIMMVIAIISLETSGTSYVSSESLFDILIFGGGYPLIYTLIYYGFRKKCRGTIKN